MTANAKEIVGECSTLLIKGGGCAGLYGAGNADSSTTLDATGSPRRGNHDGQIHLNSNSGDSEKISTPFGERRRREADVST